MSHFSGQRKVPALIFLFALLQATPDARAAGFYLQENSVSGLGNAFAGSASGIYDASTVWFNPAGMTDLDRAQISVGTHVLIPTAKLSDRGSTLFGAPIAGNDGGNPYSPTPIPNIYGVMPLSDKLWGGFGINAPFGLSSDYGDSSFIRYDSTYTSLRVINGAASLAYKVNPAFSVGGGIDVQYASANLKAAANGGALNDAYSKLTGEDVSVGYNLGIKWKPQEKTAVGLTYRSGIEHKLDGDISVHGTSGLVTPFTAPGTAKLSLPDIAAVGITHSFTPQWRGMANVTWFGWGNFKDITAVLDTGAVASSIPQNYKNTVAFSVGGEYDMNEKWTLRAGYQFDPTPTRNGFRTSRTPDGDRNWLAAGATYNINDKMSLDFAAAYIHVSDKNIDLVRNEGFATYDVKSSGHVEILSVALNYKF